MPVPHHIYVTNYSQQSDEWWTPEWIIEVARMVLGEIDLDPASCPAANVRIQADTIYTREDNGLEKTWYGRVFLNPPSKRGDPTARPHLWAEKLTNEFDQGNILRAFLIVQSVLGYKWYEELYRRFWVCHLRDRPAFVRPDGSTVGQAKKGVSVFYLGDVVGRVRFIRCLAPYGRIIPPIILNM